jgi:glycosyltransferase involved in cell wall biosynthesis
MSNYYFSKINTLIVSKLGWFLLNKKIKKCDLIHSVYFSTNGIAAGYWASKAKKPHIAQAIGSDVNSELKEMVKRQPFSKYIKKVDGIITNSYALENLVRYYFPNCPEVRTIYRGIHVPELKKVHAFAPKKHIFFLYLGGLIPYKKLDYGINTKGGITLMNSWKAVENQLFPLNATLYFGGPDSDCEVFATWKNCLSHPERVENVGMLKPYQVKEYLLKSDVVIIPSMEEGMPNLLMESYSNATPVIGSTAGGIPEVIIDGETGYVFKKGDEESLSKLLLSVSENKIRNEKMGENGYARVKAFFNADNYTNKIMKFYQKIITECVE